jgi:predicted 3-demethylubiquinone-9 3-methyltransferase (glyoxalase superfamily)
MVVEFEIEDRRHRQECGRTSSSTSYLLQVRCETESGGLFLEQVTAAGRPVWLAKDKYGVSWQIVPAAIEDDDRSGSRKLSAS